MKASVILAAVRRLLTDSAAQRWTDADLLRWLSAAQRQVAVVRPDASAKRATVSLADGIEQQLPADGTKFLSALHNVNADDTLGRGVTLTTRDELNTSRPGWTGDVPADRVRQYTFDPDTPLMFEVWPPAIAGTKLRIAYAFAPPELTATTSDLGVPDTYEGPLTDFVCARCYMEDSDNASNKGRAADHMAVAMQALTGKAQTDGAAMPKRK